MADRVVMNQNAQKWIAALRSGKFIQGTGALTKLQEDEETGENIEQDCCLGVACKLAMGEGVTDRWLEVGPDEARFRYGDVKKNTLGAAASLPEEVRKWLGLRYVEGCYVFEGEHSSLIVQNDDGKTFQEIADLIESEPERMFS